MSQISQIQLKFVSTEDRLLLRVSSNQNEEFRFWLTHRLVKLLYPAIGGALSKTPSVSLQASAIAKREVVAFEHEKAVAKADFTTSFQESDQSFPLGETPILITKCQMKPQADGNLVLAFAPEQGQGIDLNLNTDLLHSFIKLLTDAIAIAEWTMPTAPIAGAASTKASDITVN